MQYTQQDVYEFISKQTNDPIVEWRTCSWTAQQFPIFASEKRLLDSYTPEINGKKYPLSLPKLSSEARNIQRMLFRNDRVFYKGKSDHDGRPLISIYPPESGATVYEVNAWYQDFWDPFSFGRDIVEQDVWNTLGTLIHDVPRLNVDGVGCENSDFCNYCGYDKNCYMDIAGENNEDCYYCLFTKYSKRCVDCTFVYNSERCYESISCYDSNKLIYCQHMENCYECSFSFDLKNCSHCLRCWNLRNQQYCIMNKQVTKEEYIQTINQLINGTYSGYRVGLEKYYMLREQFVYPATFIVHAENSVGSNIKDIKNTYFAYNAKEIEDCHYLCDVLNATNCMDCNYSLYYPESSYQLMSTLELKHAVCNIATHHSHHVYYCQLCNNSQYLFGCVGLNNKEYCIFNKQYTKEEYFTKLAGILEHLCLTGDWGSFFPTTMSFHPYNDTVAMEYYPIHTVISGGQEHLLNEKGVGAVRVENDTMPISPAVLDLGGVEKISILRRNKTEEVNIPSTMNTLTANQLPNDIQERGKDILTQAIIDETSGRPYRIVGPEYEFYSTMHLPLPREHPDVRHSKRVDLRPGRTLHLRTCDRTGQQMLSVHPQDASYQVVAQEVYEREVYG